MTNFDFVKEAAAKQSIPLTRGERNLSELEFVRIRFLPLFEEIGICQNWNLSELEFVRIGICHSRCKKTNGGRTSAFSAWPPTI